MTKTIGKDMLLYIINRLAKGDDGTISTAKDLKCKYREDAYADGFYYEAAAIVESLLLYLEEDNDI